MFKKYAKVVLGTSLLSAVLIEGLTVLLMRTKDNFSNSYPPRQTSQLEIVGSIALFLVYVVFAIVPAIFVCRKRGWKLLIPILILVLLLVFLFGEIIGLLIGHGVLPPGFLGEPYID